MSDIEKIVFIIKQTQLEGLINKFNTKAQASFYINQMGGNFNEYEQAHEQQHFAVSNLKKHVPSDLKYQIVDRTFLPNFLFGPSDLVVVVGPDGLVINTAKYLNNQLTRKLIKKLAKFFESTVKVPRIKCGKKQSIETLINEESFILANFLRNETKLLAITR